MPRSPDLLPGSNPMLHPFVLEVALLPKAWGGARLAPWYGQNRADIGEAWLCADLAETSTSGAGGQAMISPIRGSQESLHDVMRRDSEGLLGYRCDRFPLLLKFLDAAEPVSVQVHPSTSYAAVHAEAQLKSEAWYVLESAADAELLIGSDSLISTAAMREAIVAGELVTHLSRHAATAGRCCWLPSGIIHALGAGTLVFEVQTASDTTFRLYDWEKELGRTGRTLHIDEGCAATDLALRPQWNADAVHLASTADFEVRRVESGTISMDALFGSGRDPRCVILVPLQDGAMLTDGTTVMPLPPHHATLVGASTLTDWLLTCPADVPLLAVRVA